QGGILQPHRTWLMKDVPNPGRTAELRGLDAVEEIVQDNDCHAEQGQEAGGKVDQGSQNHHGEAQHPKHGQYDESVLEPYVEQKKKTDHRPFERHEPQAAGEEKARELRLRAALARPEEGADPGSEGKYRSAEVGNPSGKEEDGRGPRQVGG